MKIGNLGKGGDGRSSEADLGGWDKGDWIGVVWLGQVG